MAAILTTVLTKFTCPPVDWTKISSGKKKLFQVIFSAFSFLTGRIDGEKYFEVALFLRCCYIHCHGGREKHIIIF